MQPLRVAQGRRRLRVNRWRLGDSQRRWGGHTHGGRRTPKGTFRTILTHGGVIGSGVIEGGGPLFFLYVLMRFWTA